MKFNRKSLVSAYDTIKVLLPAEVTTLRLTEEYIESVSEALAVKVRIGNDQLIPEKIDVLLEKNKLGSIIHSASGDDIEITADGTETYFKAGKAKYQLSVVNTSLPEVNYSKQEYTILEKGSVIADLLETTSYAMADSSTNRHILNGVCLTGEEGKLKAAGCDSYRLAVAERESSNRFSFTHVIGENMVKAILCICKKNPDETMTLEMGETSFAFSSSNVKIQSAYLAGNYPQTSRLIPESFNTSFMISREELEGIMRRISMFKIDRMTICAMNIEEGGKVSFETKDETGNAYEETEGELEGEPIKLAFNTEYLLDVLKALHGEKVTIHFAGEMKPFILNSEDNTSDIHLMLPVRTYE